jgi:hypothetical protein
MRSRCRLSDCQDKKSENEKSRAGHHAPGFRSSHSFGAKNPKTETTATGYWSTRELWNIGAEGCTMGVPLQAPSSERLPPGSGQRLLASTLRCRRRALGVFAFYRAVHLRLLRSHS